MPMVWNIVRYPWKLARKMPDQFPGVPVWWDILAG